jgi:hypothetical protein
VPKDSDLVDAGEHPSVRDYLWGSLAALTVLLLTLSLFGTAWQLIVNQSWKATLAAPLYCVFYWWIGVGAWRRTFWGRRPAS